MSRSRMEISQELIYALADKALTIDELAFECDTDCFLLLDRMDFLVNQNLVTVEICVDNKVHYFLTRRGQAVSKTLSLTKHLEKLQTTSISSSAMFCTKREETKSKPLER